MYGEERRQSIAALVGTTGRLSVTELADRFSVTTETVRRDLSALERAGLVRRVHGGVVRTSALSVLELAVTDRDRRSADEKDRIAAAAVDLLPEGGCVVLDAGTTTVRLANSIPTDLNLIVVTHAVPIAARLLGRPTIELHLLPGRVRVTTHAAVGEETVEALRRFRADVAFVGTNGISLIHGLSTPDASEASVKRAIVASARQVVVLADAEKFDEEHVMRFADLRDVDVVVTDSRVSDAQVRPLERAGIRVLVV
jgi:DeoR family fructose operon transcriptional repressor